MLFLVAVRLVVALLVILVVAELVEVISTGVEEPPFLSSRRSMIDSTVSPGSRAQIKID
jgi:hypothetical protein